MRKILIGFVLACSLFCVHQGVLAQDAAQGIIPAPKEEGMTTCGAALQGDPSTYMANLKDMDLGMKIKGGCVQLSDVPKIVIHLIDILTKLAGTIAVIFLLYAGFQMIVSGVTDDREKAKNTIKYALTGLIVSFLAWVIVNLVQVQLTS